MVGQGGIFRLDGELQGMDTPLAKPAAELASFDPKASLDPKDIDAAIETVDKLVSVVSELNTQFDGLFEEVVRLRKRVKLIELGW